MRREEEESTQREKQKDMRSKEQGAMRKNISKGEEQDDIQITSITKT